MWKNATPTIQEIQAAIPKMRPNNAPRPNNVPPLRARLYYLMFIIWENIILPSDFRNDLLVKIFKNGDRSEYGNYRGISLLSITSKVPARMPLKTSHHLRRNLT